MTGKLIELHWNDLLQNNFVYGIPNYFNGKILDNIKYFTDQKEIRNLANGDISIFPKPLVKQLKHLKSRAKCTSGIRVEFNTTAKAIEVSAEFPKIRILDNFTKIGQQSIELLVDGISFTSFVNKQPQKVILPQDGNSHRITLVFPYYSPVNLKYIKLYRCKEDCPLKREPEFLFEGKPVIFYGSSITQGGCTTRPSLVYSSQLCEKLNLNFLNLGISGAGRGEPEMAEYLASFTHASLFVLDWGANLLDPVNKNLLEERYENFWCVIHEKNPNTPILFVGLQNFFRELIDPNAAKPYIESKRQFIEKKALEACEEINKKANKQLFSYCDGTSIIGLDELHLTVDGTHPNDLGHSKYAEVLEWKLIELLQSGM